MPSFSYCLKRIFSEIICKNTRVWHCKAARNKWQEVLSHVLHKPVGTVVGAGDGLHYNSLLSLNHLALAPLEWLLQNWRQFRVSFDKWFLKAQDMLCLEEFTDICWEANVFISHIQNGIVDDVSLLCTNMTLLALRLNCRNGAGIWPMHSF